jgi:hypothetical protein
VNKYIFILSTLVHKIIDGIQGMLPQNIVPCHIEYLGLKEFEKLEIQKDSLAFSFSLQQVIAPALRSALSISEERDILISEVVRTP